MEDGFIAISNPPTAQISEVVADLLRFQTHKQALFASLHSCVYQYKVTSFKKRQ